MIAIVWADLWTTWGDFATGTVRGAIIVAAVTALISAAAWLFSRTFDWFQLRREARAEHRAAIINFYLDVKISVEENAKSFDRNALPGVIARIHQSRKDLKLYVESSVDETASSRMNDLIHLMEPQSMPVIRGYILYSALLQKQYAHTGTDDFAHLSKARKAAAVTQLFDAADQVNRLGVKVIEELGKLDYIKEIDGAVTNAVQ